MELQEVVRSRRSIWQFLVKSVPEKLIRELIVDSLWAPSWGNTQPWEIVVVTGKKMDEFKKRNEEALIAGKAAHTDIPMPQVGPDPEAPVNQFERQRGSLDEFVLKGSAPFWIKGLFKTEVYG